MSDDQQTQPDEPRAGQAHVQELIAKGQSDYAVFESLDALDPAQPETAAIREAAEPGATLATEGTSAAVAGARRTPKRPPSKRFPSTTWSRCSRTRSTTARS